MKNALIIVDPLNDFISGSLAVPDAVEILPLINRFSGNKVFDIVIILQDWHPDKHKAFASQHPDKQLFDVITMGGIEQTLWPDHCIQNTFGSEIHKELNVDIPNLVIIQKGMDIDVDSHSGFYDNQHNKSTGLTELLREKGITNTYICGLATDYCVEYTAMDSVGDGFDTTVIIDACRGLAEDLNPSYEKMEKEGIKLVEYVNLVI